MISKIGFPAVSSLNIIIIIHCLTSNTDPIWPTQTTPYIKKTCKFTGKKPLIY